MKSGQSTPQLSPQQLLSCNYMNEGCSGGWALFNGFFAENAQLVAEECAPYKVSTKGVKCSQFSECPGIARVSSTYEMKKPGVKLIQKEILRNGMVLTDWNAPPYMKTYESGLFTSQGDEAMLVGNEEPVPNHASVILGWGTDPQTNKDYWIVRNSYGADFGMGGHMLIERGSNTFNIEASIAGFDVEQI